MWTHCDKCGRKLNGTQMAYSTKWTCCDCVEDKTDILHCETGCKVKLVDFKDGWSEENKTLYRSLKNIRDEYTVEKLSVGGWSSMVRLKEFPGFHFNTIFFERIGGEA